MLVALSSGAIAGLLLFAVQHFTVVPLIESAEGYETAAHQSELDLLLSTGEMRMSHYLCPKGIREVVFRDTLST